MPACGVKEGLRAPEMRNGQIYMPHFIRELYQRVVKQETESRKQKAENRRQAAGGNAGWKFDLDRGDYI